MTKKQSAQQRPVSFSNEVVIASHAVPKNYVQEYRIVFFVEEFCAH